MRVDGWAAFVCRISVHTRRRNVSRRLLLRSWQFNSLSIPSHQLIDLCLDVHHGTLGQMHVDKCSGYTFVAHQRLNGAQMDTSLQKMGGVRMPQRMAGDFLAYRTLLESFFEAVLHTAGLDSRGTFPGGEKPCRGLVSEPIGSQLSQCLDRQWYGSILNVFLEYPLGSIR